MAIPKDFSDLGEELFHVFLTTKGARFNSHRRLLAKSNLSNLTIALLTGYVIIINLLGLLKVNGTTPLNSEYVAILTTALSILILVFSQIEASYEYKIKAEKYHDCSKEITSLYYELRDVQHSKSKSEHDKEIAYTTLRERYCQILSRYDNHNNIDYFRFKLQRDKDLATNWKLFKFYCSEYFQTKFLYHALIVLPLLSLVYQFALVN